MATRFFRRILGQHILFKRVALVILPWFSIEWGWTRACALAAAGNNEGFLRWKQRTLKRAEASRRNADSFQRKWYILATIAFDAFEWELGFSDLARALSLGLVLREDELLLDSIKNARSLMPESFSWSNDGEFNVDLRISGSAAFMNPCGPHKSTFRHAFVITTLAVLRAAFRLQKRVIFSPGYLEFCGTASKTLSYHTHGEAKGHIHFKPADIPNYVVMDSKGYAGWSSLAEKSLSDLTLPSIEEAEKFYQTHRQYILENNVSKFHQPSIKKVAPLPKQYVFVPLQIIIDQTQQLARIPMLRMLDIVIERFRITETRVVVKQHPLCTSLMVTARLRYLELRGDIILRNDSIHVLIEGSLAVITVNSGVGSEAIVHLKPIYLFGGADYAPIAHCVSSAAHFVELTSPIRMPVSREEMKMFLCYYRTCFLLDTTSASFERLVQERCFNS